MIHCNLSVLLAERRLKISRVAADTGISRTTLTALAYNNSQGIQMATLNTLCLYLGIQPDDLFSFYPYDLVLEKLEGTPHIFEATYRVRSRMFSELCILTGDATVAYENGQCSAVVISFVCNGINGQADKLFMEAFSLIPKEFRNDLEVEPFKKFVGGILEPNAPPGKKYEIRFDVIWPDVH